MNGNSTHRCAKCGSGTSLLCPTCVEQCKKNSYFCKTKCLRLAWKTHMTEHADFSNSEAFNPWPNYKFTGNIRPAYPLSPLRTPDPSIPRPSYASNGIPYLENSLSRSAVIEVLSEKERQSMRSAGEIASEIMEMCQDIIKEGISTDEIDEFVSNACDEKGVYPSLLNYRGFPKSCSTCVNEVLSFGVPDKYILKCGDILNLRIGVYYKGFNSAIARSFVIGKDKNNAQNLIEATKEAMKEAVAICKPGVHYRNIGSVIGKFAQAHNLKTVKDHNGHGINYMWRCPPEVPSSKINTPGIMLPGHAFTIRCIFTTKSSEYKVWPNGIVSVTALGTLVAQLENTFLMTESGIDTLTHCIKHRITHRH